LLELLPKLQSKFLKGFNFMPTWLRTAAGWGSILALIALLIAFVKQLIAFIGFITFAIKAIVVLAFIVVFVAVAFLVFKAWSSSQKHKDRS
jgi:hypothetical protein